jgi:1,4-dihydroxy-2-naphthoate octaprenyltransferase
MKHWIKAARLRTLPLSLSGIITGSFIAKWRMEEDGNFWNWQIFALALLVTLLYQILSNYANDYGDGVKGTDAFRDSSAEKRAVASGEISSKQMKTAVYVLSVISLLATLFLLYISFFPNYQQEFYVFVGLGISCILAAIDFSIDVAKNNIVSFEYSILLFQ